MKCIRCDEKATWVRMTQFAGNHFFCDLHALQEEDFGQSDSHSFWSEHNYKDAMEKKLYLVEVMSTFRMRYVVEAECEEHALDEVVCNEHDTDFKEFSQEHIGTHIFSSRELSAVDYMELFDKDNHYLKNWTDAQKIDLINTIDYKGEK
jgi:hypothetical protein